jgi:hypothetical protein
MGERLSLTREEQLHVSAIAEMPGFKSLAETLIVGVDKGKGGVDRRLVERFENTRHTFENIENNPETFGFSVARLPDGLRGYAGYVGKQPRFSIDDERLESGDRAGIVVAESGRIYSYVIDGVTPNFLGINWRQKAKLPRFDVIAAQLTEKSLQSIYNGTDRFRLLDREYLCERLVDKTSKLASRFRFSPSLLRNGIIHIDDLLLRSVFGVFYQPAANQFSLNNLLVVGDINVDCIMPDGEIIHLTHHSTHLDAFTGAIIRAYKHEESEISGMWLDETYRRKHNYPGDWGSRSLLITPDKRRILEYLGNQEDLFVDVPPSAVAVLMTSDGLPGELSFFNLLPLMVSKAEDDFGNVKNLVFYQTIRHVMREMCGRWGEIYAERIGGATADDASLSAVWKGFNPVVLEALSIAFERSQQRSLDLIVASNEKKSSYIPAVPSNPEYNKEILDTLGWFVMNYLQSYYGKAYVDRYQDLNVFDAPDPTTKYRLTGEQEKKVKLMHEKIMVQLLLLIYESCIPGFGE